MFLHHSRKHHFKALYALFIVLLLEIAFRSFFSIHFHIPFFRPSDLIYCYYPEISTIQKQKNEGGDKPHLFFDILMLGGSVLTPHWGKIENDLRQKLTLDGIHEVRIFNAGVSAQCTLDAENKLNILKGERFDLVLVYESLNECRLNNCPPEVFKPDYSHSAWYEDINTILRHKEMDYSIIPFVVDYIHIKLRQHFHRSRYISLNRLKPQWVVYEKDIKTAPCYRKHITDIITLCRAAGMPLLIMTYAYYIPDDYSLDRFKKRKLDYAIHHFSIEHWGKPEYVRLELEAHNRIIHEIAAARPYDKLFFIDMDRLIQKGKTNFNDICHLTPDGSAEFVSHFFPVVEHLLLSRRHGKYAGQL
jgi:hypothetical protein